MNSTIFKRVVCLLLSLVLMLGVFPAFVPTAEASEINMMSADSNAPVGITVSVGSSLITINVNRVGNSGTATLYRVAADQYLKGDGLTGKSENVVTSGTVVGQYSCGSSQQFIINRYLNDGSDNLYDKYYLVQNGNILVGPVYATDIYSMRDKGAFDHVSKKGLTLEDGSTINVAKEMGATNTVINWNLSEMIVATEDENGNPRDLSGRTDLIKYESNGKTYYFKNDYVKGQDGLISAYSKAGMNVTLVVISWAKTVTKDYPRSLMYFNQTNRQTLAYNTANDRGMEYWIAAMEFMADRYSKSANMGLVQKYIIGNEIDYTYDWYLIQPLEGPDGLPQRAEFNVFMEEFARTFRLANLAVKKYNSEAKVCVSLTHNWAESCYEAYRSPRSSVRYNSYAPKDIVDWLVKVEGARGDYDWGLAVHPYAIGTNPSNPLKTDPSGLNGQYSPTTGDPDTTAWITVSNLEVYQLYLQRPENKYKGEELRTVSLTETTVLSQNSSSAGYQTSVLEQAASIAMAYYRAANIPCIDQIAYFQLHDQTTTTYMVGLMTSDGVKKPAYDVWKYIDTDKSFVYANKYLKHISSTAKSYKDLMGVVKSDFNWDTMWSEDNIIFRTVEGGDAVRNLSTNKTNYNADDMILVTATGDWGDTVELFLGSDNIATAEPLYTYPVLGSQDGITYRSGGTYDVLAYGQVGMSRLNDAVLKAGTYKVVLRRGDTGETLVKQINITGNYSFGSTALDLYTNKTEYKSGEEIIVYASGNTSCWAGLYRKGDVPKNVTSIYWYYNNQPASGQLSGKPTILQTGIHNTDSSNPSRILVPGEYVLYLFDGSGGNEYNAVLSTELTITEAEIEGLTGVDYKLENQTDGFANGVVTITKNATNTSALNCVMFWADANGVPLAGYTGMAKFRLDGTRTVYQMPEHMIIPAEAKMLLAYASDGNTLSKTAVSVALPANAGYVFSETPNVEFQIISDIHVTTDAGATNEVKYSNKHFTMMLQDVQANSPDSIGIFIVGDIANTGSAAEYKKVLSLYYDAKLNGQGDIPELHLSIGNHDWLQGNPNKQFQYYASMLNSNLSKQPENVYYDEVLNGYHFIYLGGEKNSLRAAMSNEQLTWFDSRMAEITAEDPNKPVFVLLHQSFYNTVAGSLPGQGWDGVVDEEKLKAVMEKYGQIILLNGHSHWELNSDSNMYAGDTAVPVAFNTASVSYLWTSFDVMGGEHLDGSHGYYFRVYDDKIVVLGRDFENQKFVPSATYVVKRNEIQNVEDEYTISVYQNAVNLGATSLSGDAVNYSSSNNDIASVTDDGTVIAKKAGTVEVTITADSTDTLVVAKKTIKLHITEETAQYQVVFKNWDGTVLSDATYEYGETITVPGAPSRPSDAPDTYVWEFTGWDKPITSCQGNVVYTAQFKQKLLSKVEGVVRVFGATRYDTAFEAADMLKELQGVDKFQNIVVACGTDFADALSGSYLANQKAAPILLVRNRNQEIEQVKTYIRNNLMAGGTVYLLGGTVAIPAAMESGLNGFTVKRLAGATRYETNLEILKEAGVGDKDILVCTGKNFADGLSASAVNKPILLVKDSLSSSQTAFLSSLGGGRKLYIIGGTNAVNKNIANALASYGTVQRLEGATRYETSVNIANEFFSSADCAVLAYGQNFPDGLCGGALAYQLRGPIILTREQNASIAKSYTEPNVITDGVVLGGETLISDATARYIFENSNPEPEQPKVYTVTYALNGGTNASGNPTQYTYGSSATLAAPTKQNYNFAGWYLEPTFSNKVTDISATTVGNLTLYAKWDPCKYSITYQLGGGQNSASNPAGYTFGETYTLANPVNGPGVFQGWYLEPTFNTKVTAISATTSGNLTLYAKWAGQTYSITYVLDGGRNSPQNPSEYTAGTAITLQNASSKQYHNFGGWYLDSNFETKVTQIPATSTGALTLYAKWVPYSYTITYNLNNGVNSTSNPDAYSYGDSFQFAAPTRENYTFDGWYLESSFKTKVESVTPTSTGDMTLYAKWHLSQLNIAGEGMDNMIWNWWYYPQVVSTSDTVYWGYASNDGYSGVAAYDIFSEKTTTTALKRITPADDHNGLAVTMLEDGRIMCAYAGGHDSNTEIHIRISAKPNSIEQFDTNTVLTSAGKTSYCQIIQQNGKIYIFYRVNSKSWAYRSSADGVNWSDEVIMVSATMQYYCKVMPTTQEGFVRICMYSNPTEGDPRIRMGFMDLETGKLYNADGTTYLGTQKVAHTNFDVIIDQPQGKVQRMFDVAITDPQTVRILYTVFSNSKTANDSVYYLYDSGKTVKICDGGVPLWNPKYQGGAAFAGADTVVAARNANSTDFVEIYDYTNGEMVLRKQVHSESVGAGRHRNARPIVDVNGRVFLWHSGDYNPNSYTDFDTDAKIGFLK